jgi:F0F1-type ATP synthase assembly protein I
MNHVLARAYRLVVRVVVLQLGCGLLAACVFYLWKGASAGLAALAGGAIVALGSVVFGLTMFRPGIAGAVTLTKAMFTAVALKWLWFVVALYLALAYLKLPAAPLLVGLAAAQLGYWGGLVRSK